MTERVNAMEFTEEQKAQWIAQKQEDSSCFLNYLESGADIFRLDDTSGMGKILCKYLDMQSENIRYAHGILLTGQTGCGRHTAAYHAVRYLTQELGYDAVFLSGEELSFPEGGITQHLNAMLDFYFDNEKDLCLVTDNLEKCPCAEELLHFAGQMAFRYAVFEEWKNLFFIFIAEDESMIPPMLRERLFLCRCTPPDKKKRMQFLECYAPSLYDELTDGKTMSEKEFLAVTEGCTYAQLRDMARAADICLRIQESETAEELPEFIRGQIQQPRKAEISERLFPVLDALPDVLEKFSQFADTLPELLKNLPAGSTAVRTEPEKAENPAVSEDDRTAAFQKEVENKTTYELGVDLWGKEATDELLSKAQNTA